MCWTWLSGGCAGETRCHLSWERKGRERLRIWTGFAQLDALYVAPALGLFWQHTMGQWGGWAPRSEGLDVIPLTRCLQGISAWKSQPFSGDLWCFLVCSEDRRISALPTQLPDVSRKWEHENGSRSSCSEAGTSAGIRAWDGNEVRPVLNGPKPSGHAIWEWPSHSVRAGPCKRVSCPGTA